MGGDTPVGMRLASHSGKQRPLLATVAVQAFPRTQTLPNMY
jgi:hypothetical protein